MDLDFTALYIRAREFIPFQVGNLTTNLQAAGADPLEYLDRVIPEMFANSTIKNIELPDNITKIKSQAFLDCFELNYIKIPVSVMDIDDTAFKGCYELDKIVYEGTVVDWHKIHVKDSWALFIDSPAPCVICKDGEVDLP